jgi:hypothetical protein
MKDFLKFVVSILRFAVLDHRKQLMFYPNPASATIALKEL